MSSGYELRDINKQQQDTLNYGQHAGGPQVPEVIIVGRKPPNEQQGDQLASQAVDKYSLVFIILLLHGVGTLMPWNMFINAQDYFRFYKLSPAGADANSTTTSSPTAPQLDIDTKTLDSLRSDFLFYLSLAAQIPNVLFNGLNLLVNMGSGNLNIRVNISLALEALIFLATIILAVVDSSQWPGAFFYITMISVVILNMASGIYQNCVFGIGAKFPGNYTNAILIGSNTSGTFTSLVNLLAIWLAPAPQEAAMYYFITALLVILACIVSYNLLPLNSFFRYHDSGAGLREDEHQLEIDSVTRSSDKPKDGSNSDVPDTLRRTVEAMVPRPDRDYDDETSDGTFVGELRHKWRVFKKCWIQCLNVYLTFFVTLALFPQILADVSQVHSYFSKKYFAPFACFLVFNLFAMLGNLISGLTTWPGRDRVWIFVVARFLFIPFFLFCNFQPGEPARQWPVLIKSDLAFIVGNILLALSSGHLSSLCMMFASSGLKPSEAPKAGMLAAFFLVFGIFSGINSSKFLKWLVTLG